MAPVHSACRRVSLNALSSLPHKGPEADKKERWNVACSGLCLESGVPLERTFA